MASSTMLSTSERNNMGRERLLTCLSECGAENEPVVLLELQKAYFNKFDEYLNKAELRKFFSKGHIKQVFENFMPKDVEMATDVNATGSLFLKMKRPLRTALTDSPKSAPLMTMPKNSTEANRPALVPLPPPAPPAEQPEPSRKVLPATENNKFAVPVAAHKLLPPNRKESFSLTGGFGGAINKAEEDDLEDFVPRNTNGTTSRDRSGDTARGGGNNSETSTLVAYDGCESERRKANDGEKEKASVPATGLTMRAKPNRTLWDYDCDDGKDEKKTTPTNAKGGGDNNNNGGIARDRPQRRRGDGGGDKDAEDDKDYEAEEGDSSGDLLGDSALEDGYQQMKRQAAAAGSGRRDRNGVKPSSVGIDGVPKSQQQQQTRRRAGVASSDDDDEVAEIGGIAAATDRAIGSLLEAKWAEERRARDSLVAERLRSRKQREQQEEHQQKQSRTMSTAGTNRDATWYDDDDETKEEEQGPKKCNAGYGKRVQMSGVKQNNNNDDFGIGGKKFDQRVSSTSSSFGVANRPDNNTSKTKLKLYGGNDRFRDVPPPPFAPNLMSSDDDEGEKKDDDEENEEEGESEKEKKKVRQQDGAVQSQQKNKNNNNNNKPMLKHEEEDDDEEEEEEGPMMTMNRRSTDNGEEEEEDDELGAHHDTTTPEELQDEETEQFYQQFAGGSTNKKMASKAKKFSVDERNKFVGLISIMMSMLQNVNHSDLDKKLVNISPSGAYRKAFPSAADLLAFITNNCPNITTFNVSKQNVALLWSERSEELVSLLLQEVGKMILKKAGGNGEAAGAGKLKH